MIKLIIILIIVAGVYGIWSYEDNKIVIDTKKGTELIDKSKAFVKENVELK